LQSIVTLITTSASASASASASLSRARPDSDLAPRARHVESRDDAPRAMPSVVQKGIDKVRLMAGLEPSAPAPGEQTAELLDEYTSCASMTYEQRMYGFAFCALFGLMCSALSSVFWTRPTKFATLYSMGNLLSLASTGFLTGFARQLRNMFHGTRFAATCVYLGALIMTLVCAVELKSFPLTMVFLAVQWCALIWYCMSYIPGGRAALKTVAKTCCGLGESGDFF